MDAESDANKEIAAKDYRHTASYGKLTGADVPDLANASASGQSLHDQLMKRAHVRDAKAAIDYRNSMLGTNSFRRSEFNNGDEETRKKFLAKRHEKEHHAKKLKTDEKQVRTYQKKNDRDAAVDDKNAISRNNTADPGESIQHTYKPTHKFSEPTRQRYNPYA